MPSCVKCNKRISLVEQTLQCVCKQLYCTQHKFEHQSNCQDFLKNELLKSKKVLEKNIKIVAQKIDLI